MKNAWTRILTNYRAVGTSVEGSLMIFVAICRTVSHDVNLSLILLYLFGVLECTKGDLLLRGIVEKDKRRFKVYLHLSILSLSFKKVFIIFLFIRNDYAFDPTYFVLIVFSIIYFAYEWCLFHSVVVFQRNLEKIEAKLKWAEIMSDYRGVAHLVSGIILLFYTIIIIIRSASFGLNTPLIILNVIGAFEFIKGYLLLYGIIQNNRRIIVTYLLLSTMTIVTLSLFGIFANIDTNTLELQIALFIIIGIYSGYEWFMFYFVVKLYCQKRIKENNQIQNNNENI